MTINEKTALFLLLFFAGQSQISSADDKDGQMMHHNMEHSLHDERIPLDLSPAMKQHQLSNMRSHLKAVQEIIGLMSEEEFDRASETAHSTLGLTEEMKNMCGMFNNDDFRDLGLAFHESGDALGDALQTKDLNKSLSALQATLGFCVQCHATFRQ